MCVLLTIPWAATDWSSEGRLTAATSLPISDEGRAQALHWRDLIGDQPLTTVFASKELTSTQTAEALLNGAKTRIKQVAELHEISVGLWEGLSDEKLRSRFPKVYKRWMNDPASVCPPQGEPLDEAQDRLMAAIGKLVRKNQERRAVVLGPMACAVVRCTLESIPLEQAREMNIPEPIWYNVLRDDERLVGDRLDPIATRGR